VERRKSERGSDEAATFCGDQEIIISLRSTKLGRLGSERVVEMVLAWVLDLSWSASLVLGRRNLVGSVLAGVEIGAERRRNRQDSASCTIVGPREDGFGLERG
jgi:hypothetical protein